MVGVCLWRSLRKLAKVRCNVLWEWYKKVNESFKTLFHYLGSFWRYWITLIPIVLSRKEKNYTQGILIRKMNTAVVWLTVFSSIQWQHSTRNDCYWEIPGLQASNPLIFTREKFSRPKGVEPMVQFLLYQKSHHFKQSIEQTAMWDNKKFTCQEKNNGSKDNQMKICP